MTKNADARRRIFSTVLGVVVSGGLLWWVLSRTSFTEVVAHLRQAHAGPLLLAVAVATGTFLIRAIRWRLLLRRVDGGPLPFGPLWHATAMGFMANNTLPFRLGELVRAYGASRLGNVPIGAALSSIAVERALDGLTLVGLLIAALAGAGLPSDTVIAGARLGDVASRGVVIGGVILAGALFMVLFPRTAERGVQGLVPLPRLADRLVGLIQSLRLGFGALQSPGRLIAAVAWSLIHWLVSGAAFWIAFGAFDIRVGFAGALLVQSLLAFGVAAPSTPGYFGVFEVIVAAALALFGVSSGIGVAYGITYHITTFVPIVLLGLWSLARTGLHVRDARDAAG